MSTEQNRNPQQGLVKVHCGNVALQKGNIGFNTVGEMLAFAELVVQSGFAPKGLDNKEAVAIAMQHGNELGLLPLQSLQSIGVINGRPGIYGDAALALVRASGLMESYTQKVEGEGDERKAVVTSRRGGCEIISEFSVSDAKKAGLWGKQGPWSQYPDRMLQFRARGFNLRDNFGDVLKGMATVEELNDMPKQVEAKVKPLMGGVATEDTDKQDATTGIHLNGVNTSPHEDVVPEVVNPDQNDKYTAIEAMFNSFGMDKAIAYLVSVKWLEPGQTFKDLPENRVSAILLKKDSFKSKIKDFVIPSCDDQGA